MKPKVKYGFASFVARTHPLPWSRTTETTPTEPRGELLPNGFYEGEKVFYWRHNGGGNYQLREGTVINHPDDRVWCCWYTEGSSPNPWATYTDRESVLRDTPENRTLKESYEHYRSYINNRLI